MAAAKFITKDGNILFPCYMSDKDKQELKEKTNRDTTYMWCGCSEENKLYYKVASDLKIVPVHHGYQHSANCPRVIDRRNQGYIQTDEGKSVAYLKFKPGSYSCPKDKTINEDYEKEKEEKSSKSPSSEPKSESVEDKVKEYEKDKNLGIRELIRQINYDAFMHRQGEGKSVLPAEYFYNVVNSRLKTVEIAGSKKTIKELNLNEDNCQFFYAPLIYIGKTERSPILRIQLQWYNGTETVRKERNHFIFEAAVNNAKQEYEELYGMSVEDALNQNKKIMAAGFIVRKKTRGQYSSYTRNTYYKTYDVVGQMALFNVNSNGLYCGNSLEEVILDSILDKIPKVTKIVLPSEHDKYVVNIIKGYKQGYVYTGQKPRGVIESSNTKIFTCQGNAPDIDELKAWRNSI